MTCQALAALAVIASAAQAQSSPITGAAPPGMTSYDDTVAALMARYHVPGGAVAVMKDGRLVYARGFGWADVEHHIPVAPDALFRIASVSKPLTSAAVLTLVEAGRLSLDQPVLPLLDDLPAAPGARLDPRWQHITIRMLLEHAGGWDREQSFDPMFRSDTAARAVGAPEPASVETVIRYMKGIPLDFEPGTRNAYSNFGYAILGHVIERVTGERYDAYVKRLILRPAGAARTRLGHTRLAERAPDEVRYYSPGHGLEYPMTESIFPGGGRVPEAYGGFYLEAMAAHGAWISSAVDLLRFLRTVDGRSPPADRLRGATIVTMLTRDTVAYRDSVAWYGLGWAVRPTHGDANWWHEGRLPGTATLLVRAYNGLAWAALFNSEGDDGFGLAIDRGMWQALAGVTHWPEGDQFVNFR